MQDVEAIVIGAGQSGLAAAKALAAREIQPVVLEAGAEPVGSWPHYYDSLTLFSPARYSSLPGLRFPGDPARYPHRDEVVDYLHRYAESLDADIRTGQRVTSVTSDDDTFVVYTEAQTFTCRVLIAASGGFGNPYRPTLQGLDAFSGDVLHTSAYRSPHRFAGQHVVIVGAGNSAAQIAVELAAHAKVTLASRAAVKYAPQRPLGRDLHFWTSVLGVDHLPIGPLLRTKPAVPVLDDGRHRTAIEAGRPPRRPMFTDIRDNHITWADGTSEYADSILLATGYRPDLHYLRTLGALSADGTPLQRRGLSRTHPGLGYVGLEWQRSLASATLRGVGRDATYVVNRLTRRVRRHADSFAGAPR